MKTTFIPVKKSDTHLVFDMPGKYVVFFSNIAGTISCRVKAKNVAVHMVGLYDAKGKEKYMVHTEQIHDVPGSFSDLYVLSVVQDASFLQFSGLIRIEKNAQKSHAYQKNQNLILSGDAFVDSRPTLEILADDVFCTHGSTSGPLPKEQLNYLQMRGLSSRAAIELAVEGFKRQVYDRLSSLGIEKI